MMLKKIYLTVCLILPALSIMAQQYKYIPLPTKNTIWVEHHTPYLGSHEKAKYYCYGFKDHDTTINGYLYHTIYYSKDTIFDDSEAFGGIREDENKKVYFWYYGHPSDTFDFLIPDEKGRRLFDFSLKVGDTIKMPEYYLRGNFRYAVKKIDTVMYDSKLRKRFFFGIGNDTNYLWFSYWIEGIGNELGLLWQTGDLYTDGERNDIVCVLQDGKEVFHEEEGNYSGCLKFLEPSTVSLALETDKVYVSPNPVHTVCTFAIPVSLGFKWLEIFDIYGGLQLKVKVENIDSYVYQNNRNLKPGIYLYKLYGTKDKIFVGKLIFE